MASHVTHLVDFRLQVTQLDLKVGLLIDYFILEFCVFQLRVGQFVLQFRNLCMQLLGLEQVLLGLYGENESHNALIIAICLAYRQYIPYDEAQSPSVLGV